MNFNKTYAGKILQATDAFVYTLGDDGYYRAVGISTDAGSTTATVVLTGYWSTSSKGNAMYQTTTGKYIVLSEGWSAAGEQTYGQADAQSYVDKMIKNNKIILQNNLLCARYANKLTSEQKQTLYNLQTRLQERNNKLLTDGLVTVTKQSEAYGYNYLNKYLQNFMATGGVGLVISTTTAIVIGCVVVAALSTAAYFAYKKLWAESKTDVQYSKELTQVLTSKLTAEEYQQLLDETAGIVTKAKIKSELAGGADLVKIGLIAAGGYFLYKFVTARKGTKI